MEVWSPARVQRDDAAWLEAAAAGPADTCAPAALWAAEPDAPTAVGWTCACPSCWPVRALSLIHTSDPTKPLTLWYAVFGLKKKKKKKNKDKR